MAIYPHRKVGMAITLMTKINLLPKKAIGITIRLHILALLIYRLVPSNRAPYLARKD